VQNLVNAGLLGETAARKAILAIERQKKQLLLEQLAISEAQAKQITDPKKRAEALADIQSERLRIQALGVDPIFAEIRRGLEQDLGGAFSDFIAKAQFSLEGLRNFALGVINSFRNAIAKALSQRINDVIVRPLTNFILDKLFGIKTIDPTTLANIAATNANTAALTALTEQLATQSFIGGDILPQGGGEGELLGGQAGGDVTGPNSALGGFFDKIKTGFEKFANGLKSIATSIGGGLRSVLSSLVSFFGSIFG